MVISHNLMSMNAQRVYGVNTSAKAKSTEKLSSGYRINRAADDAAGLSISETMRHMIKGLDRASNNIEDGVSLVQVADGAMDTISSILQRCNELSIQAANGTQSESDRRAIQDEIDQNIREIRRISETTTFNETKIFEGDRNGGDHPILSSVQLEINDPDATKTTPTIHDDGVIEMNDSIKVADPVSGTRDAKGIALDFSNTKASDLVGKSFYLTCSDHCAQVFHFSFNDKSGSDVTTKDYPSSSKKSLYVEIGVDGLSTAADAFAKLANALSTKTTDPENTDGDVTYKIGHANFMDIDGSSVKFYAAGNPTTSIMSGGVLKNKDESTLAFSFRLGSLYAKELDMDTIGVKISTTKPNPYQEMQFASYSPFKNTNIQAGAETAEFVNIPLYTMNPKDMGIDPLSVMSEDTATAAIDKVGTALAYVSAIRSEYGAMQNRLEHGKSVNDISTENTTAAESRIRDTDMATEMVSQARFNILEQAGQAMMSQANSSLESVLSLLQ